MRGFIREVLTIAGVVGGLAAAYFFGPLLIPLFSGWLGVEEGVQPDRLFGVLPYDVLAAALAYGSIFILVTLLLSLASHFLAEGVRALGLGAVDRTLGFMFGILRGIILLALLYLPVHLYIQEETKDAWFEGSNTHMYIEKTSAVFASYFDNDTKEQGEDVFERAQDAVGAREKLQQIELLRKDGELPQSSDDDESAPGYDEDFREDMDALIEQKSREYNE